MANISSASGVLTVEGKKEFVDAMIGFIKDYASAWYYETEIEEPFGEVERENGDVIVDLQFWGVGRWSYSVNIDNFYRWLNESIFDANNKEDISDWKKLLSESNLCLRFDFTDEESGCGVLYNARTKITFQLVGDINNLHGYNFNEIINANVEENIIAEYDYNAENLRELNIYEEVYDFTFESFEIIAEMFEDDEDLVEEYAKHMNITEEQLKTVFKKEHLEQLVDKANELGLGYICYDLDEVFFDGDLASAVKDLLEEV